MADDYRQRVADALDDLDYGHDQQERRYVFVDDALEAVLAVRDEELERLQTIEAEVPAMVQKIRGLQIALNEETSARMASGRDAAEWRERAEQVERRAATTEATISRVRELADVYELNAGTVDGVAARNFFELFAAELRDALNPPPALLAEEETGRHVEP